MPPALQRLLDLATSPADSTDARALKRLQLGMALASVPIIAGWGLTFVLAGHPAIALFHAAYCLGTLGLLSLLALTRDYRVFRTPHLLLEMSGPFALHWFLGGYLASGGAFLWCLLAPMAAMMFEGIRRSTPWFVAMVAMALVSLARAPVAPLLTPAQIAQQFAFNTIGFVAFLYLSTRFFVDRLAQERARSEQLLLNVLPAPIAERLKHGEGTIADRFEHVTVLFSDLVGFTALSATLAPAELVKLLDEVFSGFDAIADRHGLEKIKTIGDAYMVVGGLPAAIDDHAARVARAAFEMRAHLAELTGRRGLALSMRIGIHSGEVVAGVIGKRKFSYDLWGDTVNTASRMESHGAADRVHISAATRALLGQGFVVEDRGTIPVKGKGELHTFWLQAPDRPARVESAA